MIDYTLTVRKGAINSLLPIEGVKLVGSNNMNEYYSVSNEAMPQVKDLLDGKVSSVLEHGSIPTEWVEPLE